MTIITIAASMATLQELDAFERDLHAHVRLENNLLFPKARALAAGLPA
jgi:iron-sulfur cluster repair protein YtfE (RIC family)